MSASASGDQATIYQRPVELLQSLIRFNTTNPPGNEGECIAYINRLLTDSGFETTVLSLAPERPNLITRLAGQGKVPPLLLYGHVDVATTENQMWQYPPFEGEIADGYLWGRGALDMKGGVAMMLAALLRAKTEALVPPGDVILAILSDEEMGTNSLYGARYMVENHAALFKGCKYAIGEFGGFTFYVGEKRSYPIMVAEKQVCVVEATVRGPGGHPLSSIIRGGTIGKLGHLLQQLDKNRLPVHITPTVRQMYETIAAAVPSPADVVLRQLLDPSQTDQILEMLGTQGQPMEPLVRNTVNVTVVRGGEAGNVIPSEAVAILVGGLLPGFSPDDLVAELQSILGDEIEFKVTRYDPGPAEPDMGLFDTLADILREADPDGAPCPMVLSGITDARLFSKLGIQTYGFLPMNLPSDFNFLQTLHAADERIPIEALDFGTEAIYKVMQRFGK